MTIEVDAYSITSSRGEPIASEAESKELNVGEGKPLTKAWILVLQTLASFATHLLTELAVMPVNFCHVF